MLSFLAGGGTLLLWNSSQNGFPLCSIIFFYRFNSGTSTQPASFFLRFPLAPPGQSLVFALNFSGHTGFWE